MYFRHEGKTLSAEGIYLKVSVLCSQHGPEREEPFPANSINYIGFMKYEPAISSIPPPGVYKVNIHFSHIFPSQGTP